MSLVIADVLIFAASFVAASELREFFFGPTLHHQVTIWVAAIAWLGARYYSGLYPGYGLASPQELQLCVLTSLAVAGGQVAALFVLKETAASRLVSTLTWGFVILLSWAVRAGVKTLLVRYALYGCPVVVIGAGATGTLAIREMKANPGVGYVPVALFDDDALKLGEEVEGVPVLGPVHAAVAASFPYPIRHAIIAISGARGGALPKIARRLAQRYPKLGVVPDVFGLAALWLQPRALGTCLVLEVHNNLLVPSNRILKRLADIVLAVPLLLVSVPVILVAGMLVKLLSPGPAFFAQEREGLDGRRIRVWKLRTMVPDAEARLAAHLMNDPEARIDWDTRMKLRRDPRIIPGVGTLLRKFSVDELPQFWNVVRGDMSLVGPRPFPDYHLARFTEEFRIFRSGVRPGVTGMWQVTGRAAGDLGAQEAGDSYYIRNWSLWLDLWILLRTVPATLKGGGAY